MRSHDTVPTREDVMQFLNEDQRFRFFLNAVTYATYEDVPGNFVEFGVYGGRSLALLSHFLHTGIYNKRPRRILGFDSFQGLGATSFDHSRWKIGDCALNDDASHPIFDLGDPVTPEGVTELVEATGSPAPDLIVGKFEETLDANIDGIGEAAIIHIDCDLYEATAYIFERITKVIQPGTLIAFDDWFHYKADRDKGEQKAFSEFLAANPNWYAVPYHTYGTFCKSFILNYNS